MFTWVLGRYAASTVFQYPNLSEGADRVAGQLRRDKECPFSGVTKSGTVWRKVPESDARSLCRTIPRLAEHPATGRVGTAPKRCIGNVTVWTRSQYSLACFSRCQDLCLSKSNVCLPRAHPASFRFPHGPAGLGFGTCRFVLPLFKHQVTSAVDSEPDFVGDLINCNQTLLVT